MKRAVFFIVFVAIAFGLRAQRGGLNPFELEHRLPKGLADSLALTGPTNPFDLAPHRLPTATAIKRERATWYVPRVELPKGKSRNPSFLFGAIFGMLAFLTYIVSAHRSAAGKAIKAIQNDNFLSLTQRETGPVASSALGLLYGNFLLSAGILTFLVTRWFLGDAHNNFLFLLYCIVGTTGVFLLKHLIVAIVGWAFPIGPEAAKYQFTMVVFNACLGLLLAPLVIFLAYSPPEVARWLLWAAAISVSVFFAANALRGLRIGSKFLASSQFHFLLYLCAVEIAPLFVLLKLALSQQIVR